MGRGEPTVWLTRASWQERGVKRVQMGAEVKPGSRVPGLPQTTMGITGNFRHPEKHVTLRQSIWYSTPTYGAISKRCQDPCGAFGSLNFWKPHPVYVFAKATHLRACINNTILDKDELFPFTLSIRELSGKFNSEATDICSELKWQFSSDNAPGLYSCRYTLMAFGYLVAARMNAMQGSFSYSAC